jgi:hypothetical protein
MGSYIRGSNMFIALETRGALDIQTGVAAKPYGHKVISFPSRLFPVTASAHCFVRSLCSWNKEELDQEPR